MLICKHAKRRFDSSEVGFEVAVTSIEAAIDQSPYERGPRDALIASRDIERPCLTLVQVDVRTVHTPHYTS